MKRLGRTVLSLISAILAATVVSVILQVLQYRSDSKLSGVLQFTLFEMMLVIPGWLVAIPLVLLVDTLAGWRFWFIGIVGLLIGPVIAGIATIWGCGRSAQCWRDSSLLFAAAVGVSLLTVVFYLLGLTTLCRGLQKNP